MTVFRLPDLGEGLQEAEIVAWHVSPGDHVVADQPLISVETAKAVVEVPSPQSGRIARLHGAVGDIVPVGAPLVEFESDTIAGADSVVGDLPHEPPTAPSAPATRAAGKASPAIRRLARELAVELDAVSGSGPQGTVTEDDVRRAAGRVGTAAGEPLRGPRRALARAMTHAGSEVVPAGLTDDADVTGWPPGDDPTVRLLRAVVAGCRAEPALNSWYDAAHERRILHEDIAIGLAVDTDEGLFVPVVRKADTLSADELRTAVDGLKRQVAARSIAPADLTGQTISLSNFGTLAGRYASLVVMPPQVAILGAGRIEERVLAIDSAPAVRRVLPLSLTFDHRVVTGGEAARFMRAVIASLQTGSGDGE